MTNGEKSWLPDNFKSSAKLKPRRDTRISIGTITKREFISAALAEMSFLARRQNLNLTRVAKFLCPSRQRQNHRSNRYQQRYDTGRGKVRALRITSGTCVQ